MRPTGTPHVCFTRLAALAALVMALALAPRAASADVQDDLREGDRYSEDGEWRKAGAAYDRAIKKYPAQVSPEAYAKRAAIYINLKDLEGGLAFLREVARKQHPDSPELLEQEAVILWQLNKKGDAVPIAEKAVAGKESAFAAQLLLGEYYSARDPKRTATAYRAYLKHRPSELEANDVLPRARLGFALLAQGDYKGAEEQFDVLQRKHAKRKHALVNAENGLCAAYTGLGKFDRAVTICERIVRDPRRIDANASAWFNLAKAYDEKKQYAKARTAATEYTKVRGKEAKGQVLIGDTYFHEANYERALEYYLKAEPMPTLRGSLKTDLSIQLGLTYKRLPKPDLPAAIEKLTAGYNADRGNLRIGAELGEAHLESKDDKQALTVADQLIASKGFDGAPTAQRLKVYAVAGKASYNQRKMKEARARFEKARELNPGDVTFKRLLIRTISYAAYQSFEKGDYKQVEELLGEAGKVDENDASLRLNRAVVDLKQGQCENAQRQLAGLKDNDTYKVSYHRLTARTWLCVAKPDLKKAADHYANADREVKKLNDNLMQAEIYTEWAPLTWDQNIDAAVSNLQDAVQFAQQEPGILEAAKRNLVVALFKRGWKNMKEGKSGEAYTDFERANREPKLLKGIEPLAFEFSQALASLDKGDASEAARMFKALAGKGNQSAYLKAPYNKNGTQFFAAYANYRAGTAAQRQTAATEFEKLQSGASGAFAAKIKALIASSYEFVAYDHWKNGSTSKAAKSLGSAEKYADGDMKKRIDNNSAVLNLSTKHIKLLEALGSSPPEALVNLGILYDQQGKAKDAYEAWTKAKAKGAAGKDLAKWIDAKKRIYGFN